MVQDVGGEKVNLVTLSAGIYQVLKKTEILNFTP